MADAPIDWKVACLKTIETMPQGSFFEKGRTSKQDLIWIQDLERDGYIAAMFCMGYFEEGDKFADSSIPNLIYRVHILDKGRDLIAGFEAPKKTRKDGDGDSWYKKVVIGVVIAVVSGVILASIKHYFGF
jgi:hypothetical protein